MKRFTLLFSFAMGVLFIQAQIVNQFGLLRQADVSEANFTAANLRAADFFENFQGPGPTTAMTTLKVDANTDNPQFASMGVSFADGWNMAVTVDGTNLFAASNSNYVPAGQADRWLFTPAITLSSSAAVLTFDAQTVNITAMGSGESYEVYIATSIAGATPAPADFGSPVLSIPAEATTITQRSVDLSSYTSGQTIYIAWRHTSNNKQVLAVDNIYVGSSILNDIEITKSFLLNNMMGYCGYLPANQSMPVLFGAKVDNKGENPQTNVKLNITLNSGASSVFTGAGTGVTIAAGASDSLGVATSYTIPASTMFASYDACYNVTQNETDEIPDNNKDTLRFVIADGVFSRAYTASSFITTAQLASFGAGDGLVTGTTYYFAEAASIDSLYFAIYTGTSTSGVTAKAKLYDQTFTEVATSAPYSITATDVTNMFVQLAFTTPYQVTAGAILLAGVEYTYGTNTVAFLIDGKSPLTASDNAIYLPNATPQPGWSSFTGLGVPVVGLILDSQTNIAEVSSENFLSVYPNPAVDVLNIESSNIITEVVISNILGQVVNTQKPNATHVSINTSELTKGVYMIQIRSGNELVTRKISIQ